MADADLIIFTDLNRKDAFAQIAALADQRPIFIEEAPDIADGGHKIYQNAMTFDLGWSKAAHMRGGASSPKSKYNQIFANFDLDKLNRINLSIGNHISLPQINLPVFETFVDMGLSLGKAVNAQAIAWSASGQAISFAYYQEAIPPFVNGGPFPVLGFVGLSELGSNIYATKGLYRFTGYEMHVHALADLPPSTATRIMLRFINDIILNNDKEAGAVKTYQQNNIAIKFIQQETPDNPQSDIMIMEAIMMRG